MKHTKKCRRCAWATVRDESKVHSWLVEVLGARFQYQWRLRDELGREEPRVQLHPDAWRRWLKEGPCESCPCARRCDEICALRARWWDDCMERLRRGH